MDNKLKDLIQKSLKKIGENLLHGNTETKETFEYEKKIVSLMVKDIDNELSFIVEVCKKEGDINLSNFIYDGLKENLTEYMSKDEAFLRTLNCIENLLKKAEKM